MEREQRSGAGPSVVEIVEISDDEEVVGTEKVMAQSEQEERKKMVEMKELEAQNERTEKNEEQESSQRLDEVKWVAETERQVRENARLEDERRSSKRRRNPPELYGTPVFIAKVDRKKLLQGQGEEKETEGEVW